MGTTLRVGFAMGGGNSLGTFNGAALSQALKLLLLRGIDRNGEPYEKVEVDVFSGASAGSMSLAIMLRGLVHPDPLPGTDPAGHLAAEFGNEFTDLPPAAKAGLLAAQTLQDIQEEIWVSRINMKNLLGRGSEARKKRIRFTAGMVDRGAVDELAREFLAFPSSPIDLSHRRILADRVLFASSIANLTPIVADARGEFPTNEAGVTGLSDGMTSNVHSEIRVFDLHFQPVEEDILTDHDAFPRRWCRYHAGPKVVDEDGIGRGIGSLFETRGWAKMAATSIASGAIPLAFEPVPLERRDYEFGTTEGEATSIWPATLKGVDRHVFTYVDGGTFNNEPVREAFRMASFIDAQHPEGEFERLILFVDPHVVVPNPRLQIPHHGRWLLAEPNALISTVEGLDLKKKSSLDRLIPFAGTLLGALLNESRVIEADKVFQTRKRFTLRNEMRKELDAALTHDPEPAVLASVAKTIAGLLKADREGVMIPAGALTLGGEIRRVIVEEGGADAPLAGLAAKTPDEVGAFVADPGAAPDGEGGLWLRALAFAALDRVMDLEGKMERSQLVAISPATDPMDLSKPADLPGGAASGFGGFMSELAGQHEVKVARFCTQLFLEQAHRIQQAALPPLPDFSPYEAQYREAIKKGLKDVEGRLIHVLADSHVDVVGSIPAGVLRYFIQGKIAKMAKDAGETTTCEFRLEVPNMSFEFDGEGLADSDLKPQAMDGKLYLITFATHTRGKEKPWSGPHVVAKNMALKMDRRNRKFCTIALPTEPRSKEAEKLPFPIWVARITPDDKGQEVPADRWKLLDEVRGLEETILG